MFAFTLASNTCSQTTNIEDWILRLLFSGRLHKFVENKALRAKVLEGKNANSSQIYKDFFSSVRKNKEEKDNMGEELLAVCLHVLSHLPGEADGKFCVITDDKGAAGKIDDLFKKP